MTNFILVTVLTLILHPSFEQRFDNLHYCNRKCDGSIQVCEYIFEVEDYLTLSYACYDCPNKLDDCYLVNCIPADGQLRKVQVINRLLPGPTIEVCEGDEISVIVTNRLHADTVAIHWHGLHQKGMPYMDGVPFVTQCPIGPSESFKYRMRAAQYGTHFYHAHSTAQKGNGVHGAIIIHRNTPDFIAIDSNFEEHIVLISDWTAKDAKQLFIKEVHSGESDNPHTLLVNGIGMSPIEGHILPIPRFVVQSGQSYRFRIINAAFLDVPILFKVDSHQFTVVSIDGNDVQPIVNNLITIFPGERYDVILDASNQDALYWMQFYGLNRGSIRKAYQVAVLQYFGQSDTELPSKLHSYDEGVNGFIYGNTADEYRSALPLQSSYAATLPRRIVLTSNRVSLKLFPFTLLSQSGEIPENSYCDLIYCRLSPCSCPFVIRVLAQTIVEVILVNKNVQYGTSQTVHLHGHSFVVLGSERLGIVNLEERIVILDYTGKLKRNFDSPIMKDTTEVPEAGYTIIRFKADNLGFWYFTGSGISAVFQVGPPDNMAAVPAAFPTCGNFYNTEALT